MNLNTMEYKTLDFDKIATKLAELRDAYIVSFNQVRISAQPQRKYFEDTVMAELDQKKNTVFYINEDSLGAYLLKFKTEDGVMFTKEMGLVHGDQRFN